MKNHGSPPDFQRAAFTHPLNIIIVVGAAVAAFFLSDWGYVPHIILSFLFGLQLIYLGVVPKLPRFRRYVMQRGSEKNRVKTVGNQIYRRLDEKSRHRFMEVRNRSVRLKEHFRRHFRRMPEKVEEVRSGINQLIKQYLEMLEFTERYKRYIERTNGETIKAEIEKEKKALENTENEDLRESRKRRLQVLEKRLKKWRAAKENTEICESHLETIEDTIRYMYEHTLTASDTHEVDAQLDQILSELAETSQLVEQLEEKLRTMGRESG